MSHPHVLWWHRICRWRRRIRMLGERTIFGCPTAKPHIVLKTVQWRPVRPDEVIGDRVSEAELATWLRAA